MSRTSFAAFFVAVLSSGAVFAETQRRLEDWMPGDVIAFVKIDDVGRKLDAFLECEWWQELRSTTLVALAERQDGVRAGLDRLEQFEREIGKKAVDYLDEFIGEGLLLGVRLSFPPEVLVIARSRSEAALAKSVASLKDATRARELEYPEGEKSSHRGVFVERVGGKVSFALLGDTFLVSNSTDAVKTMIDLAKGQGPVEALSAAKVFAPALKREEGPPPIFRAAVLPNYLPGFVDAIPTKLKSFPASVLGTGWLERLRDSELIFGELRFSDSSLDLRLSARAPKEGPGEGPENGLAPSDPSQDAGGVSKVFFPGEASALERAELERLNQLDLAGLVHIRRGFASWWEGRESFLRSRGLREVATFSSAMNVVFAGHSFQDEVLPRFEDGLTLVARRASFEGLGATPSPELPGFAAIVRLKNATEFKSQIARAFNTLALLLNVDRISKGERASFVVGTERVGKVRVYTVSMPVPEAQRGKTVGIAFNFTPTVGVLGSRVILGSNRELVTDLIRELGQLKPAGERPDLPVDQYRVRVDALDALLTANRSVLAAGIAKLEGVGRGEAELRLKAISEILALFEDFRMSGRLLEHEIEVRMSVDVSSKIRRRALRSR